MGFWDWLNKSLKGLTGYYFGYGIKPFFIILHKPPMKKWLLASISQSRRHAKRKSAGVGQLLRALHATETRFGVRIVLTKGQAPLGQFSKIRGKGGGLEGSD